MTRLMMISRTPCGAAALGAAIFLACNGPVPSNSGLGVAGGGGHGGNGGPIDLTRTSGTNSGTSTGSGTSTDVCSVTSQSLAKQNADILLILDRSGSMTSAMDSASQCAASDPDAGAATCQQRWATMVSGLSTLFSGAATASGDVNWGLKLYSSDGACGVTAAMDVAIGPGSAAQVQSAIAGASPGGNTPTQAALKAGVAYLQTLTDSNGKYILLATDGEPNCAAGGGGGKGKGGNGASDVPGTETEIAAAFTAGFKTYVIGVGPETGNLDAFATNGHTDHYYPALSPQDLDAALAAIVGAVASCTFDMGTAPLYPDSVAIEFNGDKSLRPPRDTTHANGWDYTSSANTAIQLYGSWCDNVTNGTYTSYQILMSCPGVPIP